MAIDEKTLESIATEATEAEIPDYSGEESATPEDAMKRLTGLVVQMGMLEVEVEDLEAKLAAKKSELAKYKESFVPELMQNIGLSEVKTKAGIRVVASEKLIGTFPKDERKRAQAFGYIRDTGNDGLLKREIVIRYGRESDQYAEQLMQALTDMGVGEHAEVENQISIHHQSMLGFLRRELEAGRPVPLEAFGVIQKTIAEIKRSRS